MSLSSSKHSCTRNAVHSTQSVRWAPIHDECPQNITTQQHVLVLHMQLWSSPVTFRTIGPTAVKPIATCEGFLRSGLRCRSPLWYAICLRRCRAATARPCATPTHHTRPSFSRWNIAAVVPQDGSRLPLLAVTASLSLDSVRRQHIVLPHPTHAHHGCRTCHHAVPFATYRLLIYT